MGREKYKKRKEQRIDKLEAGFVEEVNTTQERELWGEQRLKISHFHSRL